MMKQITAIAAGLTIAVASLSAMGQDSSTKLDERLDAAADVVTAVMSAPDKGVPRGILAGASCVVVVPSYKKAAFVVGAQYGQGVATCRTPDGWSAPAFVQLAGGSFGWQIGGQSTDLVLVAMNHNG